ncbi:hypothetical protein [Thermoactinospora rubra]|uniref:hypothetical protein n=1 Tax=Thermoactinospora rubra TaxID=1088767 RepID=UPI000A0FF827|nr:hypothetical protein [Thermoactinospora rubra]
MRTFLTHRYGLPALALVIIVAAGWWWLASRDSADPAPRALATRTVQAGEVEVRMTPLSLDSTGARFQITLDTHTVELNSDPAAARLLVNGAPAGGATWTGSAPGGHHRTGTLAYATPIPSGATVELRIGGLPREAVGTWIAPSP